MATSSDSVSRFNASQIAVALQKGWSLAVADQILIAPLPGRLNPLVEELLSAILASKAPAATIDQALLRLGMNFAGRDAEIVGYSPAEAAGAFDTVVHAISTAPRELKNAMPAVVAGFLAEMKSVNLANSLPGLLAERIQARLNKKDPGVSFLQLIKGLIRSGVYYRMIGEGYGKFGNDYARGLEYLRHFGFCQVSTNPVLAAKAFDEDPKLTEELKEEISRHAEWLKDPETHGDTMALAATLIALWPNLSIYRPLALFTFCKDYMVSFQLNPNLADQAEASILDARHAYRLAADYLKHYDELLGLGGEAGRVGPNIVFKIAGCHEAAREITRTLNAEGVGSNNTVVYTVAQEIQLILDAMEGKAKALKTGKAVTRTYETNMGGRFSSHLREVAAEKLFVDAAAKAGEAKAMRILEKLAKALKVDEGTLKSVAGRSFPEKAAAITAFKFMKTLDVPDMLAAGKAAGVSAAAVREMEKDIKKAGTLVARRVYAAFYSAANRPLWVAWLAKTYSLTNAQAVEILDSMDILPASKRIPEDTYHALGSRNMCHTEFPNHSRAVQVMAEDPGFRLEDFKDSVLAAYDPGVSSRLSRLLPDFILGYELTPALQKLIVREAGVAEARKWGKGGIEPAQWHQFGPVRKTLAEFQEAYFNFRAKCVALAKIMAAK